MNNTIMIDDFYEFQTTIRRAIKDLVKDPSKRLVLSAKDNPNKSKYKRVKYYLTITDDRNIHFYSLDSLIKGKYAVLASPDLPTVEEETDETL